MDNIEVAKTQAMWYAWGRKDAEPEKFADVDAWEFGEFYAVQYRAFVENESSRLRSIQAYWQEYTQS